MKKRRLVATASSATGLKQLASRAHRISRRRRTWLPANAGVIPDPAVVVFAAEGPFQPCLRDMILLSDSWARHSASLFDLRAHLALLHPCIAQRHGDRRHISCDSAETIIRRKRAGDAGQGAARRALLPATREAASTVKRLEMSFNRYIRSNKS
jgi:hypothetical protein